MREHKTKTRYLEQDRRRRVNHSSPADSTKRSASEFTNPEQAEIAAGIRGALSIQETFNIEATKTISLLAKAEPEVARRTDARIGAEVAFQTAARDTMMFDAQLERDGPLWSRKVRHLSRGQRILLLVLFAAIDILMLRLAVRLMLDTRDDFMGQVETWLVALLAFAIIVATAAGANKLRALHDAREHDANGLVQAPDIEAAERDWYRVGISALVGAALLLAASTGMRMTLFERPTFVTFCIVLAIAAAPAFGAFLVEFEYANRTMDKRDDLVRRERRAGRALRRTRRAETRADRRYAYQEAAGHGLWPRFEPMHEAVITRVCERIAAARAERPEVFEPTPYSVIDTVRSEFAKVSTRVDLPRCVAAQGLQLTQIKTRASERFAARRHTATLTAVPCAPALTFPLPPPALPPRCQHPLPQAAPLPLPALPNRQLGPPTDQA